jgi:hypothetical protein
MQDLNRLAAAATFHCLTGCAIGEVVGMVLATALEWSNLASIAVSIVLAFFFGYSLTSWPLIRARMSWRQIASVALAADTVSIAIMEAIDNGTILVWPGALDAGLADALFWGSLAAGFAVAWPFTFLANRSLIARGRGHAVVHQHHEH